MLTLREAIVDHEIVRRLEKVFTSSTPLDLHIEAFGQCLALAAFGYREG